MGYPNVVIARSTVVGEPFLTSDKVLITDPDVTVELVLFGIDRLPHEPVTAIGIVICRYAKVHIIADRQIIPSILDKIASIGVITKGREKEPRGPSGGEWNIFIV